MIDDYHERAPQPWMRCASSSLAWRVAPPALAFARYLAGRRQLNPLTHRTAFRRTPKRDPRDPCILGRQGHP